MKKRKKINPKLGDVVAIPLPNGRFAYAKVYRDAGLGVYDLVSGHILPVEDVVGCEVVFVDGCFFTSIENGEWKIIGNDPFEFEEDAWPPPHYIEDVIIPSKYRIYHKGDMRPASAEEVKGLDRAVVHQTFTFINRIMKDVVQS